MIYPGMLIQNRYRVIRKLGKGGFGQTFEVDEGGTLKVLKVLNVESFQSPERQKKSVVLFLREATVLSRLEHPGIPRVERDGYFNYLDPGGNTIHCLLMEKIEGKNLKQWLATPGNQPLSEELAIAWLEQLADILAQLHQQELIHRDIKPSNIMLRPNGQLVLIDFGAVREVTETYLYRQKANLTGTVIISAGFTPPEQAEGQAVAQSDFFALGRTFVYLLTGKRPIDFNKNPRTGKLYWHDSAPQISPKFADLIDYLMAPFPGRRPQTSQVILRSLEEITSPSVTTHPDPLLSQRNLLPTQVNPKPNQLLTLISGLIPKKNQPLSWHKAKLRRTLSGHSDSVKSIAISPDGRTFASGSYDKTIKLWALPSGELQRTLIGHRKRVNCIAISPDGQTLASSSEDMTIKFWALPTGDLLHTLRVTKGIVRSLNFNPNGKTLISSSGLEIKFWAVLTGKVIGTLVGHSKSARLVNFSPDGKSCVIGGLDGTLELWSPYSGKRLRHFSTPAGAITSVAFSPDGQILASGSNRMIEIWNPRTGKRLHTFSTQQNGSVSVAFSPDSRTLASSSGRSIDLWNLPSAQRLSNLSRHYKPVQSLAFSTDGSILISGSDDNTIKVWQIIS
ncbi:MAG: protein kinase [Symploca sp. SIO1C4]|uniref:Protein kinase n=1 Tax=Symploca sp. SIO1C4 TaxID=2607765 RepID=A0A6B3N6E9_9CYAN|nr:protein kinase [Symploca sp. SIO1C4]NET05398.1 protein kinase [Symploca sp. SIO2B6]